MLAHLSEYVANIQVGMKVGPGQVVGKVGTSGQDNGNYEDGVFIAHLHITYYDYDSDNTTKDIFAPLTEVIGISDWLENDKLLLARRDPFDHTVVRSEHVEKKTEKI